MKRTVSTKWNIIVCLEWMFLSIISFKHWKILQLKTYIDGSVQDCGTGNTTVALCHRYQACYWIFLAAHGVPNGVLLQLENTTDKEDPLLWRAASNDWTISITTYSLHCGDCHDTEWAIYLKHKNADGKFNHWSPNYQVSHPISVILL